MNTLTKTNTFARPRLFNWMTAGLLTGWVLMLAVVVEVNGLGQEINIENTFNPIEAVKREAGAQFCSIYTKISKFG